MPNGNILLTAPVSYLDFLRLLAEARRMLTDSGGIQKEATILRVPGLPLRRNTDRPITIESGTNGLVGADPESALNAALQVLDSKPADTSTPAHRNSGTVRVCGSSMCSNRHSLVNSERRRWMSVWHSGIPVGTDLIPAIQPILELDLKRRWSRNISRNPAVRECRTDIFQDHDGKHS
jgi:hypothetical protein